jgi:ABC-type sulfate transport system permease component
MLFTLYVLLKAGVVRFFTSIFKDPMVVFCFWYSILFAVFVGTTTLNFGTLVRYKIPCIPFYLIALILILEKSRKKKSGTPVLENAASEKVDTSL